MLKIAYLGDVYTHTYAAAEQFAAEKNVDLFGYDSVTAALEAVARGECDRAVVPIENSFEGTVTATVDALRELGLYIQSECVCAIEQNLITLTGVAPERVKKVYSHPQALAQCRSSIKRLLPNATAVAVAYTSAGLNMLDGESAAIARAPKFGQTVAAAHIEDSPDNCTRFVYVGTERNTATGGKVSVSFATPNNPGALLGVLKILGDGGYNMTKIESRPAKKLIGQYVFNVDFAFDGSDSELSELLDVISRSSGDLRFLGRYGEIK